LSEFALHLASLFGELGLDGDKWREYPLGQCDSLAIVEIFAVLSEIRGYEVSTEAFDFGTTTLGDLERFGS
jgi:hypothetical protein